jgi:hypothetical protein
MPYNKTLVGPIAGSIVGGFLMPVLVLMGFIYDIGSREVANARKAGEARQLNSANALDDAGMVIAKQVSLIFMFV